MHKLFPVSRYHVPLKQLSSLRQDKVWAVLLLPKESSISWVVTSFKRSSIPNTETRFDAPFKNYKCSRYLQPRSPKTIARQGSLWRGSSFGLGQIRSSLWLYYCIWWYKPWVATVIDVEKLWTQSLHAAIRWSGTERRQSSARRVDCQDDLPNPYTSRQGVKDPLT